MTREEAIKEAEARGQTATIKVMKPCDCAACLANRAWFWCERISENLIAEYAVDGLIDAPLIPHPDAIRMVEKDHPGCVFVYIG